jgi:hypothetical protein
MAMQQFQSTHIIYMKQVWDFFSHFGVEEDNTYSTSI